MNNIDYTKWHDSMFCRICEKELNEKDRSTKKVKVNTGQLFSQKVKVPVCNECGAHAVGFSSKMCFETNPVSAYFRCFLIILFMSGILGFLVYIFEPKEGVSQSTANVVAVLAVVFSSAAMIWIINRQNTLSKEIIKKIESKKDRQTI
jgi:hypothetical protein